MRSTRIREAQQPVEIGQVERRGQARRVRRPGLFRKVQVGEDQREAAHGGIVSDP